MRLLPILVVIALALGLTPAATPAADAPTIQQFLKIRTPNAPRLLPDGSLLMRDWPDGVWQLYRVIPGGGVGSASYEPAATRTDRLTEYPDGLADYSASPDGRFVVLMHARGGNENTQLTLLELSSGATTPVLADPKVQARVSAWARDNSAFFYTANDASPTDFHVYRWDIATRKATKLLGREGSWFVADATADGSRLLVGRFASISETHVYELEVKSGKLTEITIAPQGGTASCGVVGYMPKERAVLMISDQEQGRERLYVRDLKSGKVNRVLASLGDHELDGAAMELGREMVAVVTNEDGYGTLRVFRLPGLEPVPMPAIEKGVVGTAGFIQRTLVWTINNARTPGVAYAATFDPKAKQPPAPRRLTWTDNQGLDLSGFTLPELVRFASFDGREVPGFVLTPPGYVKGTSIPFVVVYHGGPESQSRPTFNATYQYLLTRGFGILLPNVRGSTGYGREYHMLDNYKNRWDSVRDGVAAADWLVKSGYSSPGRIAAYGGSYGGFMSVACIVEDQEAVDRGERKERLFGACVDIVGIVNMKTFLERTSGYRRKLREAEYGPLSDGDFLASVSSLHRVDKIQVPVFIAHGFNDPRVPIEEAMQLAAALREKGRQPRMFVAPDEGHGFQKLDNRIYFGERAAAFLEETLKGEKPAVRVAAEPSDN